MRPEEYSPLALAYIGDAHYGLMVKRFVVDREVKPLTMQKLANRFVSANSQCRFMEQLLKQGSLTDKEIEIYKRGRNAKSHKAPKNSDPVTYHVATGFEAMWGYLFLNGEEERLEQIWDLIRTMEEV